MDEEPAWQPGEFQQRFGETADDMLAGVVDRNIREAASWRLVAELVRRYAEELLVAQSVPITGVVYDCLRVVRLDGAGYIDVNRAGTGSGRRSVSGLEDVWSAMLMEWLSIEDRRGFIRYVSDWLGMPPVTKLPATTARTLVCRTIAGFLEAHGLDLEQWRCECALILDDLDRPSLRKDLIAGFVGLDFLDLPTGSGPSSLASNDAANAWLLTRDGEPVAVFLTDGTVAVQQVDETIDLMAMYGTDRTVDSTVAAVAHLLAAR